MVKTYRDLHKVIQKRCDAFLVQFKVVTRVSRVCSCVLGVRSLWRTVWCPPMRNMKTVCTPQSGRQLTLGSSPHSVTTDASSSTGSPEPSNIASCSERVVRDRWSVCVCVCRVRLWEKRSVHFLFWKNLFTEFSLRYKRVTQHTADCMWEQQWQSVCMWCKYAVTHLFHLRL